MKHIVVSFRDIGGTLQTIPAHLPYLLITVLLPLLVLCDDLCNDATTSLMHR